MGAITAQQQCCRDERGIVHIGYWDNFMNSTYWIKSHSQSCSRSWSWSHEKIDRATDLDLKCDLDQYWWSWILDLLILLNDLIMRSWSWSLIFELIDVIRSKINIKDLPKGSLILILLQVISAWDHLVANPTTHGLSYMVADALCCHSYTDTNFESKVLLKMNKEFWKQVGIKTNSDMRRQNGQLFMNLCFNLMHILKVASYFLL